jgi:hypothetical protein
VNDCHYNLRLTARDKNFIRELHKYGDTRTAKNNDKYLTQAFSTHLRAVFVMQTALMFRAAAWISPVKCDGVFNELDRSFVNFEKIVDRLDRDFKNLYRKKLGKKK